MTSEPRDLTIVIRRLERLERENRRLKQGAGLFFALIGSIVMMGQSAPQTRAIEAQRFILKDGNGTTRAALGMIPAGPSLEFYDPENGKLRVTLNMTGVGSSLTEGLTLYDARERMQAALVAADEGTGLGIYDAIGNNRIILGIGPEAGLVLHDANGKLTFSAPQNYTLKVR